MRKRITYQISLSPKSSKKETEFLVEQYRVLSADRLSHDQLFWNVQIMGLTAQSFLLILALGGFGNASWVKAIGAFIGLIYSFLSIQGFERNRYMELSDAESMLSIERSFINQGFRGVEVHDKPPKRKLLSGDSINQILCTDGVNNFFSRSIGYFLWKNGLWAILVTNAFLLIYNIIFYSFKNLVGKFFLYASFKVFWNSFSSFAIASILALIVLNWVLFLAEEIIMQQPKCISKYYYSGVVAPIQKELKHRNLDKNKIKLYTLEAIAVIILIVYSAISYFNKNHYPYFTWTILFFVCSFFSIIVSWKKIKRMKVSKRLE